VKSVKIIGLPVIVSARFRIVLDKNIRTLYGIDKDDTVLMDASLEFIRIKPYREGVTGGEKKNITIGRFNLPITWANRTHIKIGDYVYLVATDTEIIVCPKNIELVCIGGLLP
jgi:bifunctional DNA-binding transcriptional regulator/antitoxin component of YhaV-PrlF toxin-antitoxin module